MKSCAMTTRIPVHPLPRIPAPSRRLAERYPGLRVLDKPEPLGIPAGITVGMVDPDIVERETQRVGRELHAGFPTAARHPLKALDGRAMDYAASDEALRAALFRFVDVVP